VTTLGRGKFSLIFNLANGIGESVILYGFGHPSRIMMLPEMVQPGGIIHSFTQLQEENQVLGAEIELSRDTPEAEASIQWRFTFGVFSPMPPPFHGAGCNAHDERWLIARSSPDEGSAWLELCHLYFGCELLLDCGAINPNGTIRFFPKRDDGVHTLKNRTFDLVWLDRHIDRAG
jgi:hypothetical protein